MMVIVQCDRRSRYIEHKRLHPTYITNFECILAIMEVSAETKIPSLSIKEFFYQHLKYSTYFHKIKRENVNY